MCCCGVIINTQHLYSCLSSSYYGTMSIFTEVKTSTLRKHNAELES